MFSIHSMVACQDSCFVLGHPNFSGALSHLGFKRVTTIFTTNHMNLILFVAVEYRN